MAKSPLKVTALERMRLKLPHCIPIVLEKGRGALLNTLDNKRFMFPRDKTFGQFLAYIRSSMNLDPQVAMFFFVDNMQCSCSSTMDELYASHCDEDGFLHMRYCEENVFGKQ